MGRAKSNTTSITKVSIMYHTIETGQIAYEDPVAMETPSYFNGWGSFSLSESSPTVAFYVQPNSHFKLTQYLSGELMNFTTSYYSIAVSVVRYDELHIQTLPSSYMFVTFSDGTPESYIYYIVAEIKQSPLVFYFLPKDKDIPELFRFGELYQFLVNCAVHQAKTKFNEFSVGDLVFIPALGIYGTVTQKESSSRYVVKAEMFKQTINITVNGRDITPV